MTDKDIDRLTKHLLEGWLADAGAGGGDAGGGSEGSKTRPVAVPRHHPSQRLSDIGDAVVRARDACRLRYLNAAAAVTYGLPTAALAAGDA